MAAAFANNYMTHHHTETSSIEHRGGRIAFDARGSGAPVLFIQGTGLHGDGWFPQIDVLSANYRCVSFDNRGMSRSQPLCGELTVEVMAEDAVRVIQAQGWESAHIVGHSLGGLIALQLALAFRERVRSLALLCTFARGADVTRPTPWMIWTGLRTHIGARRQRRRAFLEMVLPPETLAHANLDELAERFAPIFGHDLADQPAIAMKQLRAMSRYDASPRLGKLANIPTLVVSAQHDRIARPEFGRALAAGIPGARYVELAGAAHGVPIENPAPINSLLQQHLEQSN